MRKKTKRWTVFIELVRRQTLLVHLFVKTAIVIRLTIFLFVFAGQTRPVQAIRFVMADSIEERVLRVQEAKQTLGKGILKRLKKEERGKAKVTALRDLFEMDQHKFVDWEGVFDDNNDDGLSDLIMGDDV